MLDWFLAWDYELFGIFNGQWHTNFLDVIFPYWRNKYFWSPLYLFILLFLIINYKKQGWFIVVGLVFTLILSDQISSSLIKPFFNRLRPCRTPELVDSVRVLVRCGHGKSFVSAHATNHFAIAVFLINIFGHRYKWLLPIGLLWAFSIAYGQVYVGVHFPLDIFCGGLLGISIGYAMSTLAKKYVEINY